MKKLYRFMYNKWMNFKYQLIAKHWNVWRYEELGLASRKELATIDEILEMHKLNDTKPKWINLIYRK